MWSGRPGGGNPGQWTQWSFNPNSYAHLPHDQGNFCSCIQLDAGVNRCLDVWGDFCGVGYGLHLMCFFIALFNSWLGGISTTMDSDARQPASFAAATSSNITRAYSCLHERHSISRGCWGSSGIRYWAGYRCCRCASTWYEWRVY